MNSILGQESTSQLTSFFTSMDFDIDDDLCLSDPQREAYVAAYAAAGRFGEAVETVEKAPALAESANQQQLVRAIKKHLELYKTGRY